MGEKAARSLGQRAYEAWLMNLIPTPLFLPTWADLPPESREAWESIANAVVDQYKLNNREG